MRHSNSLIVAAVCLSCTGCTGLVPAQTVIRANPFTHAIEIVNTKDVSIDCNEATYSHEGGFAIRGLSLRDTASTAAMANALQMQRVTEQIEQHGKNIALALQGISSIAGQLAPLGIRAPTTGLGIETPYGTITRGGTDADAYAAYLAAIQAFRGAGGQQQQAPAIGEAIADLRRRLDAIERPTSQPVQ